MAVGEAFAVQETGAETNVSNTTEATETYDASAQLEQGDWSGEWNGATETLNCPAANANLPILVGHSKFVRGSGTARSIAQDTVRINTTNQNNRGGGISRYVRISGGADEMTTQGVGIFELSSGDDILIRRSVTWNSADRVGDYDRSSGDPKGFWAAVLPANDRLYMTLAATATGAGRYGQVSPRPIDMGATPSTLTSGSWATATWNNDSGHPVGSTFAHTDSNATWTIAANKKVLCVLTYVVNHTPADRNSILVRVRQSSNTSYPGGATSTYVRNATSDNCVGSLIFPIFTGGSTETLDVAFVDQVEEATGNDCDLVAGDIQLIDLTDADWVVASSNDRHVWDSIATFTTINWDQTLQEDTASWSHDPVTNNSRLTNNAGATITAIVGFSIFADRDSADTTRRVPHGQIARNGTRLDYGVAGNYSRGDNSADGQQIAGFSHAIP
ncbi:MAG: hypothetical protein ACE5NA_10975, partial [Nitrospiraceae bacterium]